MHDSLKIYDFKDKTFSLLNWGHVGRISVVITLIVSSQYWKNCLVD